MSLYVDIEKRFNNFFLKTKFEIKSGVLAVFGESGCGKSLTLKCIAGIEKPDNGKIILNGRKLFDSELKINIPSYKRNVGYLFQNYALFPNMTVEQNIYKVIKRKKAEKIKITSEIIKKFYLEGLEKKYPKQLSGGQQQKTAIARMIASDPEIMMFDEPFSALDDFVKWKLEQEFINIVKEFNKITLFVSHNIEEVYRISDKIAVMNNGFIEKFGNKKEIFKNPDTLSTALLTGCNNISRAVKKDKYTIKALDWQIDLKLNQEIFNDINYIGIHSQDFKLADKKDGNNIIKCRILKLIEDINYVIIVFCNAENHQKGEFTNLNYKILKSQWNGLAENGCLYLKLPENRLIQMR